MEGNARFFAFGDLAQLVGYQALPHSAHLILDPKSVTEDVVKVGLGMWRRVGALRGVFWRRRCPKPVI